MSTEKVKLKWGAEKNNAEVFKNGLYLNKSKMAYSIMMNKSRLDQPYEKIRELFGENDGFILSIRIQHTLFRVEETTLKKLGSSFLE